MPKAVPQTGFTLLLPLNRETPFATLGRAIRPRMLASRRRGTGAEGRAAAWRSRSCGRSLRDAGRRACGRGPEPSTR